MTTLRLLPILVFALASLAVLKTADLFGKVGVELSGPPLAYAGDGVYGFGRSDAASGIAPDDITGSASAKPPAPAGAAADPAGAPPATVPAAAPPAPADAADPMMPLASDSPSERAILERLQQRREQLDQQARELDMRENLLKATEKRIEGRLDELKQLQASVGAAQQQQDDANGSRMKGLVTMYEAMKPKDAARIFDRLDMAILVDVASAMKPAKLGDVIAAMDADAAQKLTVALANRSAAKAAPAPQAGLDLPKIEGQPKN